MASTADPLSPDLGMASNSRHTRVVIDNEASDDAIVIRVDSVDSYGTLLNFVEVISDLNLVIRKAYISSDGNHFVDVFHITDKDGNKVLDEAAISCIQKLEFDSVEIEMAKEKSHESVTVTNVVDQFQGQDMFVFEDVKFSVSSSLKGGIDITLGSSTVHMPQLCSIRHPLLQMVLFATKVQDPTSIFGFRHTIPCAGPGVAKSILNIIEKSSTDASTADVQRPVLEAGWVVSRKRPAKCNGGSVCTRPGKKPDCKTDRSTDNASTVSSFMQLHHQLDGSLHLNSVREQEHKEQQCRLKNQDAYALVTTQSPTPGGGNWVPALWLDSGASHHAVGDARALCNFRDPPAGTAVRVADGFRLLVTKVGDIQTEDIQIPDVYLVPGLQMNLISVRQLARSKIIPTFYENHAELWQEGELVGGSIADEETSLYRLHHLTPAGNAAAPTS